MREIKFRGWIPDKKIMMSDWPLLLSYNDLKPTYLNQMLAEDQKKGYVLMQFTGLKDKNGKEIYEGDILFEKQDDWRAPDGLRFRGKQWYWEVVWKAGELDTYDDHDNEVQIVGFCQRMIPGHFMRKNAIDVIPIPTKAGMENTDPIIQEEMFDPLYDTSHMEIIGNTYENPEFIKKHGNKTH